VRVRVIVALLLGGSIVAAQPRRPTLAVIIVVDQMRADYVERFQRDWTGGLKRFAANGAVFENAAYPYLNTVTCVGHATIATGTLPRTHGIIQNAWWDRERGAQMTCTEDLNAKGIGYKVPFTAGDSAWRLQRPTLTDVLRTGHGARVVTMSLKDRSAIMLAGHGADSVTWFSESLEGWVTSSAFAEGPIPAVQEFVNAHPVANDFGKAWTRLLPAARYTQPDDQAGESPPRGWSRTFPHVLNGTGEWADAAFIGQWQRSPFANDYLERLAVTLTDALSLGRNPRRDAVDVLAVSFSTPDLVGHGFGPRSQEVQDIYAHLDQTLAALFDHLNVAVGPGRWVAALSADHGVTPIPEQLAAEGKDGGRLPTPRVTAAIEERMRGKFGPGRHVAQIAGNDIYFVKGDYEKLTASPDDLQAVLKAIADLPGVARVFRSEDLRDPALAKDALQRAASLSYFPGRSGDLIMALKPGWMFGATGATHGSANPDDQRVPVMFLGAGVKPGRYSDAATPADLAPTLAALVGVEMKDVDGKVLSAAIVK
jgi:predicted AlkP superfamily pyrophosphatase or phosphodiesterase